MTNSNWTPKAYGSYKWIVQDPDLLGGHLAVRGTRLSVSHILACLAEGMDHKEMEESYGKIPKEAIAEVLKVAAELAEESSYVAA